MAFTFLWRLIFISVLRTVKNGLTANHEAGVLMHGMSMALLEVSNSGVEKFICTQSS